MKCLPIVVDGRGLLIIVLEKGNLERMKEGDPASLPLKDYPVAALRARDLELWICYEEDMGKIAGMMQRGEQQKVIQYLKRGWKEVGDDGSLPTAWKI